MNKVSKNKFKVFMLIIFLYDAEKIKGCSKKIKKAQIFFELGIF